MLQSSHLIVCSSIKLDLISTGSKVKLTGFEIMNNRSSNLKCSLNIYINVLLVGIPTKYRK